MNRNVLLGFTLTGLWLGQGGGRADGAEAIDIVRQLNRAFIEVADKVSPSVAVISVAHRPDFEATDQEGNPLWDWLPPQMREQLRERLRREGGSQRQHPPVFDGQGSGIVIREDGYILTNRHVVDGADKIKVRFKDGKEFDAEIRGVDPQSDIAVIKINGKDLPAARFADSDKVRVGEFAIAIGAPFDLDYSVTVGHVSAKGRSRVILDQSMDQDFIQTDASINPGNSGGPLVNIDGEVIGINTLIRGLRTGIGFAIPSNLARKVSEQLVTEGRFVRAWLGVAVTSLKEDEDFRQLAPDAESGVVVRRIEKDSPASKSDLKTGDIITTVEGRAVNNAVDLRNEVRAKGVGQTVQLDVIRGAKKLKIKVTPEEWPQDLPQVAGNSRKPAESESTDVGMTLKPMSKELAKEFGVEMTEGLLVTEVQPGSLAERRGLQKGDIITEVDRTTVAALRDYRAAMKAADLKKGTLLNLIRDGVSTLVVLKDTGD